MFARPSIAQASLGLSLVFALIQPALSQISANGAGTIAILNEFRMGSSSMLVMYH